MYSMTAGGIVALANGDQRIHKPSKMVDFGNAMCCSRLRRSGRIGPRLDGGTRSTSRGDRLIDGLPGWVRRSFRQYGPRECNDQ